MCTITTNYQVFLKIGNHKSAAYAILKDRGCRTQAQFEAVLTIICNEDFLYACSNPFHKSYPGEEYKYSFMFRYFTKDGYFRSVNITPGGKLTNHWCSKEASFLDGISDVELSIMSIKRGISKS